jgi:hypothetical protein
LSNSAEPDEKVAFSSETVEHIASLGLFSGVGVSFYTRKRKDGAVPGSQGRRNRMESKTSVHSIAAVKKVSQERDKVPPRPPATIHDPVDKILWEVLGLISKKTLTLS